MTWTGNDGDWRGTWRWKKGKIVAMIEISQFRATHRAQINGPKNANKQFQLVIYDIMTNICTNLM